MASEIVRARSTHTSMAGLRFAVLLAASSSFGVLLLAASASALASRPPAVYGAGDEWRAASASNDGSHQTLSKWAMRHRFYVGDVLDFKRSNDSVLLVRQGDYERCSAASPARRFADGRGDGDTRFTLGHPGLFYFISGAPARCKAGQRMVVRVVDARYSLGGTLSPGTMVPKDLDPQSGDRPIPVWFKVLAPAAIGFLAGCFFAGVIMWLCMSLRRAR